MDFCLQIRRPHGVRQSWFIGCTASILALLPARVVLSQGEIVSWGLNTNAQCDGPPSFVSVAAGSTGSLGFSADGRILAWGWGCDTGCVIPAPNADFVAVSGDYGHGLGLRHNPPAVTLSGLIAKAGRNCSGRSRSTFRRRLSCCETPRGGQLRRRQRSIECPRPAGTPWSGMGVETTASGWLRASIG